MTRPMPGPPGGFTDRARLNYALMDGQITYEQYREFDKALIRAFTARPKRLTDAECAAEYWRAALETASAALTNCPECPGCQAIVTEELTWHLFATTPHALEES